MGDIFSDQFLVNRGSSGAYRDSDEPDYAQYLAEGGLSSGLNVLGWRAAKSRNASATASASQDRAGMQSFISANRNPNDAAFVNKTTADFGKYGNVLDAYLAQQAPAASNVNRFDSALNSSESRLNSLLDDPNSVQQSAAYKFRVGQGQEALQRTMGAKGMLNSGNRLMELTKYGQDMGSQEYDAQYGRLKGLYDSNSQSWIGDKNANTSRFAAESQAHNGRGNMLSDLYSKSGALVNQSSATANDNGIKWGSLYENGRQANQENAIRRAQGGPNGTFAQAYGYGGY